MSKKIAVLFPGIGYTCDKPLLYYAGKIAMKAGYELMPVRYGNFPSGVKGNREKMEQSFYMALQQSEEILQDVDWASYDDVLFISKSVGTIVAASYMQQHKVKGRSISFTPLADTFRFAAGDGIMFHGTADPWAEDTEAIKAACEKAGQPLYLTEGANHSLETGDVLTDLQNIQQVMEIVAAYINTVGD